MATGDMSNLHEDTKLVALGRNPARDCGSVNPPVHRTSTVVFESLEQLEAYDAGKSKEECGTTGYGRFGTPTVTELETALCTLEGGHQAWVTASGCSAYTAALMACLNSGDHLLMTDASYGPTRKLCNDELSRLGIETTYYDPEIGAGIEALIKENTKVIFVESPGSLTFEMQDIPAIAKVAHARGITVIADNTWGTPYFSDPFALDIDVTIHSATKYIAGHSDLIMGLICANESHAARINRTVRNLGACASGDNCFLALRGLRTMGVRMRQQQENALKVAQWLQNRPEVARMLCPFLPGDKGYDIWQRDFSGAASLFGYVMADGDRNKLKTFTNALQLFGLGYSWGGFESLLMTCVPHNIRTATKKKWQPEERIIRLHIGLENPDDLIADLAQAFEKIQNC